MEYFVWEHDFEDKTLALINRLPEEIDKDFWMLHEGISCKDWFPKNVTFKLDPDYGDVLGDSIPNTLNFLIVSKKLRDILAAAAPGFEFFPVSILNARNKKVKDEYFVANLVGTIMCTDMKKSEYSMSHLDEGQVSYFTRLVLEEGKIAKGTQIFRLGEMTELYLVNEPLGKQIVIEEECTNVGFTYLEDYGMDFRKD